MKMELSQSLKLSQSLTLQTPIEIQWSLTQAFERGQAEPPPYVEPTFEEEEFTPRLKLVRSRIPLFDEVDDHGTRMFMIDDANEVFRYKYAQGYDEIEGEDGYYRIPLLRNYNVNPEDIAEPISAAAFIRAQAIFAAVGEMERIARAVPYSKLYHSITMHLAEMGARLEDTVIVSVDRGGRIPCIILMRALGLPTMQSLKVNQGGSGDGLDQDRLEEFAKNGTLTR